MNTRSDCASNSGCRIDPCHVRPRFGGAVYVFAREGTARTQQAYVKASNTDARDSFGSSIGLSADGRTLAVGAWWEASSAIRINGDQSDDSASQSGAVYALR